MIKCSNNWNQNLKSVTENLTYDMKKVDLKLNL